MGTARPLDSLDLRLLLALNDDPRGTVLALADATHASRNTVQARLQRIEQSDLLRPFDFRIDPTALGYSVTASISITSSQRYHDRLSKELAAIPEILYVFGLSGGADLTLRVVARDADDLYRITGEVSVLPGVERIETNLTMRRLVDYRVAPLLRKSLARRPD